jgi:diguanylate cyclase (GGDEF)-like protein
MTTSRPPLPPLQMHVHPSVPSPRRGESSPDTGPGRNRYARFLTPVLTAAAVLIAAAGMLLPGYRPPDAPLSPAAGVVIAVLLVAAGQLARLRFRLGRGTVSVSWGEAAFVISFALAPAGWLPVTTLAGTAGAWALISWLDDHRRRGELLHLAASLTLGSAGAAAVSTAVTGDAGLQTARMQVGLVAGAFTYLAITFGLAVLTLTLHQDAPAGHIVVRALNAKVPMVVGNVLVGLGSLFVLVREPLWLIAFAPALWLLQRTYRYHLRADEERRIWEAFARAITALPAGTESEVATAGLSGALDVFGARRVEIEVLLPAGGHRRYAADGPGRDVDADGLLGPVITRSMTVSGTAIGELTVWMAEPTRPVARDELAVSAYGDALAGALHDAAAHERLDALDARMAHDCAHDPLTGLSNRATMLADGDELLLSFDRDRHVALLLLDLNGFREVNATLGHKAGDDVLRTIGQRLNDLAHETDLLARVGDDEFALLLPDLAMLADSATPLHDLPAPLPQALRRARELVDELGRPMEVAGVHLVVEVGVGVVTAQAGGSDLAELLRKGGMALGQAKELRVAVAAYDNAREAESTDHLSLLAELRVALDTDDQLVLALQPEVDLVTGAPAGVEALIRWKHPRRGQLSPGAFVETVENSELLTPFTRRVLDLALTSAAEWSAAGLDLPVSVNVSARSLLDPAFPGQVVDALHRHRLSPRQLVLEITESVAVSDQEIVDEVLAALRDTGVQLSVDDFGTGFSSLAFVTRVTVDELKVDRSFVEAMIDFPAAEAIVRGAVELGARLGTRVVAEGVETVEQRTALIELGCESAQGYHFCQPMPADKIVAVLRQLGEAGNAKVVPLRADDAS